MKTLVACTLVALGVSANAQDRRPFTLDDVFKVRAVSDPQISPDGQWVAYAVRDTDLVADRSITQIWMVSWDGRQRVQLTHGMSSASAPRWSPDGRRVAFLAARHVGDALTQVWVMDRRGGEAYPLTQIAATVDQYAWSPDSRRLALVFKRKEPMRADAPPQPVVIDRYQFKNDDDGYVHGTETRRIYLFEVESKALAPLTDSVRFNESDPAWSPDGTRIAFVSNREPDWDRIENPDVWVADAKPESVPRRLTTFEGQDEGPLAWSPDGLRLAYVQGLQPGEWRYRMQQLAVIALDDGHPVYPTHSLDRHAFQPRFSADGRFLEFLTIDSHSVYPARVPVDGGAVRPLVNGKNRVVIDQSHVAGRTAVSLTADGAPAEIYALEGGRLRQLTAHNDDWLSQLQLAAVEDIEFSSEDGTRVKALLTRPLGYQPGNRYPSILWIHGGPYGQDDHEFDIHRQLFAARGYAVIQVNYRGSAGRGRQFAQMDPTAQGVKDLADLIAGVDHVIAMGVADPQRLGVGGWSYGGIMTNHLIAHDPRFKAAIAGAATGNKIALYGSDQYVYVYDTEWGAPWKNPQLWMQRSDPFFHADRIRTPTLFVGGQLDFNVPISGAEQMYQALKSLGVPCQLVIYPDEHHSISRPSFRRDLLQRYQDWYAKYL